MNTSYFHKDFECLFDLFRCHLKADRNCCANVTAIIRNFNVYDSTLITVFFFDWSESNVTEWMVIDDCWMISGRYQSYKTSMIGDWIRDQSHESSIEIECYAINAIKVFPHCFQLRQFLFVWEIYDQFEKKPRPIKWKNQRAIVSIHKWNQYSNEERYWNVDCAKRELHLSNATECDSMEYSEFPEKTKFSYFNQMQSNTVNHWLWFYHSKAIKCKVQWSL